MDDDMEDDPNTVFVVIQEGGASGELYASGHGSVKDAVANQAECAKGAYRTGTIVEVPKALAETEGFWDAIDAVLASMEFEYRGTEEEGEMATKLSARK